MSGKDWRAVLAFRDPDGQRLELLDDEGKLAGVPWKGSPIPAEMAIRGLYGVRFTIKQLERTEHLLTGVLGFRRAGNYQTKQQHEVVVFEVGPGGPGTEVQVFTQVDPGKSAVPQQTSQAVIAELLSYMVGDTPPPLWSAMMSGPASHYQRCCLCQHACYFSRAREHYPYNMIVQIIRYSEQDLNP